MGGGFGGIRFTEGKYLEEDSTKSWKSNKQIESD